MALIKIGISGPTAPLWPAPPRGKGYLYVVRGGRSQQVVQPHAGRSRALFAELAP